MKRLIVFAVLFFAIIFGFKNLVVYLFKPSERLTQEISYFFESVTHYKVSIGGAKVVWNPYPTLEISDVKLLNPNKEKQIFLHADKVVCEFSLFDLILGRSSVKSIYFFTPKLYLKKNLEHVNWNTDFLTQLNSSSQERLLNNIFVENGVVVFENLADKITETFTKISAKMALKNSGKVFRFSGNFEFKAKKWNLNLFLQKFVNRYEAKFKLKEQESNLQIEAQGEGKEHDWKINGYFKVSEPNKIFPFIGIPLLAKQLNVPMLGNFSYVSDKDKTGFPDFTVRTDGEDGITFTGSFWDKKDDVDLVFFINRVDEALIRNQLSHLKTYLTSFQKKVNFEFLITRLISEKFTLKENKIKGSWFDKVAHFDYMQFLSEDFKFLFSGEGKNIFQDDYVWQGNVKLEANKLHPVFLKFLPKLNIPDTFFNSVVAEANIEISPKSMSIELLEGKIDDTLFQGKLQHLTDQGNVLNLSVSNIKVDDYLKLFFSEGFQEGYQSLTFNNKVFGFIGDSFWTHIPNTKFDIKMEYLVFKDEKIDNFLIRGAISEGNLMLEEAKIDVIQKADILFSGGIDNIGKEERVSFKNFLLDVKSEDFPYFLNFLNLNTDLIEEKNTTLSLKIDGSRHLQQVKFNLVNGNLKFNLDGNISYNPELFLNDCQISLVYPNFHAFLKNIGFNKNILSQLDGWLNATFVFAGNKNEFTLNNIKTTIGVQELQGSFSFNQKLDSVKGVFTTDFLDLSRVLPTFSGKENVDLMDYPKEMDLSVISKKVRMKNFLFSQGEIELKKNAELFNIKSFLEDKKLLIELSLNDLKEQYLQVYLNFSDFPLSPKVFSKDSYFIGNGQMTGDVNFKCKGTFEKSCFDTLDGNGKLNVKRTLFGGIDIKKVQALLQQLSAEYINKERFIFGVDTALGQGVEEASTVDFSLIFTPAQIQIKDLIFEGDFFSGTGDVIYSNKKKDASFFFNFRKYPDLKPLELTLSFQERLNLKFNALDFYQSTMANIKKVNLDEYKNDKSKKLLASWSQKKLEYQGIWLDVKKWAGLEHNSYLIEEVKILEEEWEAYSQEVKEAMNLSEDEFLEGEMIQQELTKKLESIYQQMLSNFEQDSISGTISFKESIITE